MASIFTNKGAFRIISQATDWTSATIKIALAKNSYTPSKDHNFASDFASDECDAGGYAGGFNGAGRKTLASRTVTEDDANDRVVLDAADPSNYTLAAGNTLRYAPIVEEVTNDSDSPLIAVLDMGGDKITNGGDLDVNFDAVGCGVFNT